MQAILDFLLANPIITMICTLLAATLIVGAKIPDAIAGALKLAIAITGIVATVGLMSTVYQPALRALATHTGINLPVADVGWAPIATITWSSPYTFLFIIVAVAVNIVMIKHQWTKTLDIDIFDVWHLAFTGLLAKFCGAPLWLVLLFIAFLAVFKFINADLMKPTFDDLLGNPASMMTTTHLNYMINPIVLLLDRLYSLCFSWLDRFDIDAAALNSKIGFAGSRFALGTYIGLFVGLLGRLPLKDTLTLAFTLATTLEIFNIVGSWFTAALDPLSQALTERLNKWTGSDQPLRIGLDWAFLSTRSEVWATANLLAPIMFLEALVLPGNKIMPLGGIIAMGVTPALLVVTRGKVIRMVVIGAVELPLFLWAGSLSADFVTSATRALTASHIMAIGASTKEGPIEQFLAIALGKSSSGDLKWIGITAGGILVYVALFIWYARVMRRRNHTYMDKAAKD